MNNGSDLTPTQQRMMDLLLDGAPHSPDELKACMDDELANPKTVRKHLSVLRKKLPPGVEIVPLTFGSRRTMYRMMRHVNSPNDGRT